MRLLHSQTWNSIRLSIFDYPHSQQNLSLCTWVPTTSKISFGPNRMSLSFVPTIYLDTCFIAFQCDQPEFFMNLLMTLTEWAMSSPIVTIVYIKEPTSGAYDTDFISSPSGPNVGQSRWDSRRLMGSTMVEDLTDCMLEHFKTRPI